MTPYTLHYPQHRAWLFRWMPRRCSCGVSRYARCPDRPGATGPEPMPAIWAYVFIFVGCCVLAGGWAAWQAIA